MELLELLSQMNTDACPSSSDSNLPIQDSEPGLLDVFGCDDIGNVILDKCGVICLAKLSIACKASRKAVQQYNCHSKRIFPVRCGGFDHEYYTFWKDFDKERAARATIQGTLDTDTLLRNDTLINEARDRGSGRGLELLS